jgi:DNA-binding CsgD family transcriptional regulator
MRIAGQATSERDLTPIWNAGISALEILGIAWLVCDSSGRLLHANETASRIFKARFGLWRTFDGRLCCARDNEPLIAAIRQVSQGHASNPTDHSDILFLQRTNDRNALTLLVRPFRGDWVDDDNQAVAIVLILDPSLNVGVSDSELGQLCGFSPAESRIANLLMDGLSLDQCSVRLHVQVPTTRARLKRMLRKTATRHQSELVSLLLKRIGLVRLKRQKANLLARMTKDLLDSQAVTSTFCSIGAPQ